MLRFAGGRELTLGDLGARQGLLGGINAIIVGNYLTTLGRDPQEDLDLLAELSMPVKALSEHAVSPRSLHCDGCGRPLDEGDHARCRERRAATDPPRFCTRCGRKLVVQVLPIGYTARVRALRPAGAAMTDVDAVLEELRAAGLFRRAARDRERARARASCSTAARSCCCARTTTSAWPGTRALRAAAAEAAERWGAGAGASRLVSGHMALHARLEEELAAFKGTEACLLFGSGFLANTGVIAALAGRGDVMLSDALNHASIVDGCRLARAETVVYPHADLDALERRARARAARPRAVIVTDAVFSMDGDLAPLAGIVALARRHGARVVVDEAHATGVVGPGGRGLVAELGLEREVDVVVGTLGKALGTYGAFVCCDATHRRLTSSTARAR